MIDFKKFTLKNGLKVIVHTDTSTPLACLNILYNVGAKDEDPEKTGFAHLFEHLMFGGSINIPNYDTPLQLAGGENNAFTNNDITNYYLTVPAENIETGFWLESDRMLSLAFTPQSLEVQRNVVIEEFKQRYLNQPYGDVWLLLRPLAYKTHPYKWPTIGKEIKHIENATLDDVKDFFKRFYCPNNAIMVVAGNVDVDNIQHLCQKWFEPIPSQTVPERNLPQEEPQTEARELWVERNVPANALYKVYHMPGRLQKHYHACDLISDILSNGKSARLYNQLVKEKKLFTEISAFIMGDIDPGLFVIQGKLSNNTNFDVANKAIEEELQKLQTNLVEEKELQKVKNKVESSLVFSEMNILNKAMNLAYYELLGDANKINTEIINYQQVTTQEILETANYYLSTTNCSTLFYKAKK
jgi:predicted Zn-dependent peptidase